MAAADIRSPAGPAGQYTRRQHFNALLLLLTAMPPLWTVALFYVLIGAERVKLWKYVHDTYIVAVYAVVSLGLVAWLCYGYLYRFNASVLAAHLLAPFNGFILWALTAYSGSWNCAYRTEFRKPLCHIPPDAGPLSYHYVIKGLAWMSAAWQALPLVIALIAPLFLIAAFWTFGHGLKLR